MITDYLNKRKFENCKSILVESEEDFLEAFNDDYKISGTDIIVSNIKISDDVYKAYISENNKETNIGSIYKIDDMWYTISKNGSFKSKSIVSILECLITDSEIV